MARRRRPPRLGAAACAAALGLAAALSAPRRPRALAAGPPPVGPPAAAPHRRPPPGPRAAPGGGSVARAAGAPDGERGSPSAAGEARSPGPAEEVADVFGALWRLMVVERVWADPLSAVDRADIIVLGARLSQIGAVMCLFMASILKLGMLSRMWRGLTPVDDTTVIEYSGRLLMLVSGVLLPLAQLSLFGLLMISLGTLALEELQAGTLQRLGVDFQAQRERRYSTVGLMVFAVLLAVTPPQPEGDFFGAP